MFVGSTTLKSSGEGLLTGLYWILFSGTVDISFPSCAYLPTPPPVSVSKCFVNSMVLYKYKVRMVLEHEKLFCKLFS